MLMPLASPMVVSVNVNTLTASKSIEVVASPDATITSSSPVAADSTAAASVADAGPGATYQWSIANGTISGPANGREVAYIAGDHGQVALDVIVTAATGCTASASFTASIQCPTRPAPLNLMITYHGVTSGCSESNGRLCAPHEEILLSVSSEGMPVDDCDDVTWTYGTSHANGAKVSVHLDAPGTYAVAVDVRNPVGSSAAETKIGIGADRRRAARH